MSVRSDELKAMVDDAWAATETLSGCEPDVRQVAFERLLTHLLSGDRGGAPAASGDSASNGTAAAAVEALDTSYDTEEQRAEVVGRYLGIAPEEACDLFDLGQAEPTLRVAAKKLPKSRAEAVRTIALLVCGARTALGMETGTADIRAAADEYQKSDSNFMVNLTEAPGLAVRGKARSKNRLVRMRVIGMEEARSLATSLVS